MATDLTSPLNTDGLKEAFPRDTRGMTDSELESFLRVLERAIRTQYKVSRVDSACDEAMRDAMIAGWPSFLVQVKRVSSESSSAEGYSVSYSKDDKIKFPGIIESMLADYIDSTSVDSEGSMPGGTGTTSTPIEFSW